MTKAEVAAMKAWGEPGIFLLGFVDAAWLQPWSAAQTRRAAPPIANPLTTPSRFSPPLLSV